MNTTTSITDHTTSFTIKYDSLKVGGVKRFQAIVYANGKKVYTGVSNDSSKVRTEVNALVRNLTLYGYEPTKAVGAHEQVWYLFRELKDSGKLTHAIRAAVLLQRHTWSEGQALTMLETLKELQGA